MNRLSVSLNGIWDFAIDPYYRARQMERYLSPRAKLGPHADDIFPLEWHRLRVPGSWNLQRDDLFLFSGNTVYQREFAFARSLKGRRAFLRFEAANYRTRVWLNGTEIGEHLGGFGPFSFEITKHLKRKNHLFVEVENAERADRCPTVGPDWFNYGGIVRDVAIDVVPKAFIADHRIWWDGRQVRGTVAVDGRETGTVRVQVGRLLDETIKLKNGRGRFAVKAAPRPWSPADPHLVPVTLTFGDDVVKDRVGFRTIRTDGATLLLNDQPIRLKGVSVHAECAEGGRTLGKADRARIFELASELGLNFLRLAHYPHDREMAKLADKHGILLWEEIPVYWRIDWQNKATLADAKNQLDELIRRDQNRASVIIWSVANETPADAPGRTEFLTELARRANRADPTRLVSLALFVDERDGKVGVFDPIGEELDVIAFNTYPHWYGFRFDIPKLQPVRYEKPHIVSEWGGGARVGLEGTGRFTEAYQAKIYRKMTKAIAKQPLIAGTTPWILADFRSLLRTNSVQEHTNLKGLVDITKTKKKQAFFVYRDWEFKQPSQAAPSGP
jgi:beta-glucuronidase